MFLIGGPAFSGTTLLAWQLNQGGLVCLDEPDFEDPRQRHRGIAFLRTLFPDRSLPEAPAGPSTYEEAWRIASACERAIHPWGLGFKTCDWRFVEYARIARRSGAPVIAIVRDVRDALVRPLPEWVTEETLNHRYRVIWRHRDEFDLWLRYEDLTHDPAAAFVEISRVLARPLVPRRSWDTAEVHAPMFKTPGHEGLRSGRIGTDRVGIWRASGRTFSTESHETARLMGYP